MEHRGAIPSIIRQYLVDIEYGNTSIEPCNEMLESFMQNFVASRGLECEQLERTLHLAASFVEQCYPALDMDVKKNVALFNWFLIYVDDQAAKVPVSIQEFQKRLLSGQSQIDPVLNTLTDVLNGLWDQYDSLSFNSIFGSVMSFLTSSLIENSLEEASLISNNPRFAWFMREGTGISKAYATFAFPKHRGFQGMDFIQVLPDMDFWIGVTNDLLSFYKEELQGDKENYVHMRARNENKTPIEVLFQMERELIQSSKAISAVLGDNPDALAAWKAFERGYIEWHLTQDRYKLRQLLL